MNTTLDLVWSWINAIPPTVTTIRFGVADTCLPLLVNAVGDKATHWNTLVGVLLDQSGTLTVEFWEWNTSSQDTPQVVDMWAMPDDEPVPVFYELRRVLRPCRGLFKARLEECLQVVTFGAQVKIM